MAQYWLEIASDTPLSQFTREFSSAATDLTAIVLDGSDYALSFQSDSTVGGVLKWNDVADAADMEVMTLIRRTVTLTTVFPGPAGRVSTGVNAYLSRMRGTTGSGLQLLQGASSVTLQNTNLGVETVTSYHWRKLGLTGTTVREKVWTGAVTDEPASWRVSVTDAALSSGGAGIGTSESINPIYTRILSVGTDGDPAPTGPVGPPASRRRSPLLLTPW